ncbi:DUF4403 family protein [Aquirufa sp. TARAVU-A1A]
MRNFLFLLLLTFFTACKRQVLVQGTPAQFQLATPAVRSQTVAINFSMRYDSLFRYFQLTPGKLLFDSQKQKGIDFPLQIALLQPPRLQVGSQGNATLELPVKIDARPNIAGINTGLIQAKSNISLAFQWNWQDINHHQLDLRSLNYQWISKPEMRVLGFPVQVQGIVDPMIQRQIPAMQEKVAERLNQALSPSALRNLLNRVEMNFASPLGQVSLRSADVDVHDLTFNSSGIAGKLLVRTALILGESVDNQPNRWLEMKDLNQSLPFQVSLGYDKILGLISQALHAKPTNLQLSADSVGIHVQVKGLATSRAMANIIVVPALLDSSKIGLNVKGFQVEGVPFFLRGHVRRKVLKALMAYSWSSSEALSLLKQNTWGLAVSNGELRIQQLTYSIKGLGVVGEIRGNWELRK